MKLGKFLLYQNQISRVRLIQSLAFKEFESVMRTILLREHDRTFKVMNIA